MEESRLELLRFAVPAERSKSVRVRGVPRAAGEPPVTTELHDLFSMVGPIFSLRLTDSGERDGCQQAFVRFYSFRDAARAARVLHRRPFAGSILRVQQCVDHARDVLRELPLSRQYCCNLANYYFGFNGWSNRILGNSVSRGTAGNTVVKGDATEPVLTVRAVCAVEVLVPAFEIAARGFGEDEEKVQNQAMERTKLAKIMKMAMDKALSNAFSKIIILLPETGPIAALLDPRIDDCDDLAADQELTPPCLRCTDGVDRDSQRLSGRALIGRRRRRRQRRRDESTPRTDSPGLSLSTAYIPLGAAWLRPSRASLLEPTRGFQGPPHEVCRDPCPSSSALPAHTHSCICSRACALNVHL
ncbi:RAD52 motif-containing protein 1 isoform X2 [Petromyzon marinus]|uniref:RAD52 motif-containing protein 1 isoform X2 n=1 Tax=Petromyzon marinus TaxID=7757 RepID=UPI003F73045A